MTNAELARELRELLSRFEEDWDREDAKSLAELVIENGPAVLAALESAGERGAAVASQRTGYERGIVQDTLSDDAPAPAESAGPITDTERLDFVQQNFDLTGAAGVTSSGYGLWWVRTGTGKGIYHEGTAREAIDLAIRAEREGARK